ncbi:MAG TPA: lipoyl(octanoyl) transferase LipB [Burkholderiaceae bacterium]|nr:lipoyl(octanoyl) transferase LipB [Burkholderiaceae bacterium]
MRIRQLGRADYVRTWHAMRDFSAQRGAATEDELWLVEHPPVFTLGQAGRREHLLAATDIPVVATDRGGQITYHGPGQVVAYPLLDLRRLGIYVKELVFRIEQSVIQTLHSFGIDGRRIAGAPGVFTPWLCSAPAPFTGLAKIAALGIKVAGGRSYHGVSLNVAMDLTPYALIDPCGYSGLAVVDLATLGVATDCNEVAMRLAERLQAHLSARAADSEPALAKMAAS